jgi:hypothetical protein
VDLVVVVAVVVEEAILKVVGVDVVGSGSELVTTR